MRARGTSPSSSPAHHHQHTITSTHHQHTITSSQGTHVHFHVGYKAPGWFPGATCQEGEQQFPRVARQDEESGCKVATGARTGRFYQDGGSGQRARRGDLPGRRTVASGTGTSTPHIDTRPPCSRSSGHTTGTDQRGMYSRIHTSSPALPLPAHPTRHHRHYHYQPITSTTCDCTSHSRPACSLRFCSP